MRHRAVTANSFDINVKRIHGRHDRTRRRVKPTRNKAWRVMNAVNVFDVEGLHDPFLHHDFRTATVLFCGLKNQSDATRKVTRFS